MPAPPTIRSTVERTRRNENLGTFAERFPILFESSSRRQKAAKILAVLHHSFGENLERSTILEVGSSTGIMAFEFARVCGRVVAFDLDAVALRAGAEYARNDDQIARKISFLDLAS